MSNNVDKIIMEAAYDLVHNFLDAINRSDFHFLASKLGMRSDDCEEILKEIKTWFFDCESISLSPPPRKSAIDGEEMFELYGAENDYCWGIDCALFNNGKRDEPMIHFDLFRIDGKFSLKYLYIGS
ncbi:MAG: hypothetical protein LBF93_02050 [Zoogloeaceae bacterium]|jgi:hypothetical protein|nr:hypothetical protein [Zoogloeaceae bacterium]